MLRIEPTMVNDDSDDHRHDDALVGAGVALADLGEADGKHAVEREGEDDARHHRDERKVDGDLGGGHREADQDLADRVARTAQARSRDRRRWPAGW